MIIFYFTNTTQIINHLVGFSSVVENDGKYLVDGEIICNTTQNILWKYISEQVLERDGGGAYMHDADYYEEVTPPEDRLASIEMALLDLAEALL